MPAGRGVAAPPLTPPDLRPDNALTPLCAAGAGRQGRGVRERGGQRGSRPNLDRFLTHQKFSHRYYHQKLSRVVSFAKLARHTHHLRGLGIEGEGLHGMTPTSRAMQETVQTNVGRYDAAYFVVASLKLLVQAWCKHKQHLGTLGSSLDKRILVTIELSRGCAAVSPHIRTNH